MPVILGTGAYRYEVVDGWAKLPPGREFNADVAAVGIDKQDRVYAFNRGAHPMVVFDRDGNFLRSWGEGKYFDSISVCLSKGLGAPVGSVLLGNKSFIAKARRIRKVFGGGMRQAGIMAAAGIYALDNNIARLKEDHLRAKQLGEVLKGLSFVEEMFPVETNIIIFRLNNKLAGETLVEKFRENQIKISAFGKQSVRLVTHLDFDDDMLDKVIDVLKRV